MGETKFPERIPKYNFAICFTGKRIGKMILSLFRNLVRLKPTSNGMFQLRIMSGVTICFTLKASYGRDTLLYCKHSLLTFNQSDTFHPWNHDSTATFRKKGLEVLYALKVWFDTSFFVRHHVDDWWYIKIKLGYDSILK